MKSSKKIDAEGMGKQLAEYGSLDNAIEAMKSQLTSLSSRFEELQRESKMLKAEVEGLTGKKITLKKETKNLEILKQTLSQSIGPMREDEKKLKESIPVLRDSVGTLEAKMLDLEGKTGALQKQKAVLESDIKARQQVKSDIAQVEAKYQNLLAVVAEAEAKIDEAGKAWDIFHGFLGLVGSSSYEELDQYLEMIPHLVAYSRKEKHSIETVKQRILVNLTQDRLQVLKCTSCGVRFVIEKPANGLLRYLSYKCPIGVIGHFVVVDQDATSILQKALATPETPHEASVKPIRLQKTDDSSGPGTQR